MFFLKSDKILRLKRNGLWYSHIAKGIIEMFPQPLGLENDESNKSQATKMLLKELQNQTK